MADLKIQHILTLAHLFSKGAKNNFITVTSGDLGKAIGKSQQAASKHLLDLEKNGFVERISEGRNYLLRITPKGYNEMIKINKVLDSCLDSAQSQIILKGTLVSGMGEGAYYMSLKGYTKQFKSKIGYAPYPGTLNVKLDKKQYVESIKQFDTLDGMKINGFSDGKRTYGWVKCFSGTINSVRSELIRLERTHHDPSVIELISKHNIRKSAKLHNGSKVTIKISV